MRVSCWVIKCREGGNIQHYTFPIDEVSTEERLKRLFANLKPRAIIMEIATACQPFDICKSADLELDGLGEEDRRAISKAVRK